MWTSAVACPFGMWKMSKPMANMDLVFHFYRRNTTLTCTSTIGQLKGFTYQWYTD